MYGESCCGGLDFLADGGALFALGTHEFVIELEIHPHARGDAEVIAEAVRRGRSQITDNGEEMGSGKWGQREMGSGCKS